MNAKRSLLLYLSLAIHAVLFDRIVHSAEAPLKALYENAAPICPCERLTQLALPNTTIDSAAIDPNDGSCRVTASVTHPPSGDRVRIFIALPVTNWNGRFRGTGGGGFSGGSPGNLRGPVAQGFATAATDTGHEGGSGSFALDKNGRLNWQAIRDNAYLGIHEMTVVGKAVTRAFYGKEPRYSYFVGGSTGGRQGLMEAQRYPEDYNGILSACPAINWDRFLTADLWPQVVMFSLTNLVPKSKFDAVTAEAVAACDGADGVIDGVIDDPSRCEYDPKALVGREIAGSTFTETDAEVVRRIWAGPRAADGRFLWHGLARGTDLAALAGTGGSPLSAKPFSITLDWFRYFLLQDPQWPGTNLSVAGFELLLQQAIEQYASIFATDNPDLAAFRDRGGKLIVYYGLIDQLIPAMGTIEYFQQVQERMGGEEKTGQFARLFLAPGVDHGFRGPGATPVGQFEALVRWVEQNEPPEKLLAEKRGPDGKIVFTRPLFPFPHVAKYKGSGSTDLAENFEKVRRPLANPRHAFVVPALWEYTAPLISPERRAANPSRAQKDPTVVFHEGRWHVFMTVKLPGKSAIEHCSFERWERADESQRTILPISDSDYYCAPQVFYFRPHKKWYLIYQMGVPGRNKMWVAYSTTENIADPTSWTQAQPILDGGPSDPRREGGLDYWIICDDQRAYLFFTSLNGKMWRLWTRLEDFPRGFAHCELALQAKIFEASHTYKLKGQDRYLTIIEEDGRRFYKAYLADRLDGEWTPVADTAERPFAGWKNVRPAPGVEPWTDNISHGELIRDGIDETLAIDPQNLRFLFQGMLDQHKSGKAYGQFDWRLGLLSPARP